MVETLKDFIEGYLHIFSISYWFYIFLGVTFVEFTFRSFICTNFIGIRDVRSYFNFRFCTCIIYLIYLNLIGNNILLSFVFAIFLTMIDILYSFANKKSSNFPLRTFWGLLWLYVLLLISYIFSYYLNVSLVRISILTKQTLSLLRVFNINISLRNIIIYTLGYFFAIHASNHIVTWVLTDLKFKKIEYNSKIIDNKPVLLDYLKKDEDSILDESLKKAGRYIGSLERILVISLVSLGIHEVIGYLFAIKTIARFETIRKQAEYYLVGTLTSFLIALVISGVLKLLII